MHCVFSHNEFQYFSALICNPHQRVYSGTQSVLHGTDILHNFISRYQLGADNAVNISIFNNIHVLGAVNFCNDLFNTLFRRIHGNDDIFLVYVRQCYQNIGVFDLFFLQQALFGTVAVDD